MIRRTAALIGKLSTLCFLRRGNNMRAIYPLSILNNDFFCILDRNMRCFPPQMYWQFRVREVKFYTWISITLLTYDEESKCVTIRVVSFGKLWIGHFPQELAAMIGLELEF